MNLQSTSPIKLLILPILIILVAGCSTNSLGYRADQLISQFTETDNDMSNSSLSAVVNQISEDQSLQDGMVAFDGIVFVASTEPIKDLWQLAGWKIGNRNQATDDDQVPADCTLYPHQGVEEQWIGSCQGHTFIPRKGASHIAVIHTTSNGETTLVQVAPQPELTGP